MVRKSATIPRIIGTTVLENLEALPPLVAAEYTERQERLEDEALAFPHLSAYAYVIRQHTHTSATQR